MTYDFFPYKLPEKSDRKLTSITNGNKVVVKNHHPEQVKMIFANLKMTCRDWCCGYLTLPLSMVPEKYQNSDNYYMPQPHGGVTYCEIHGDYIVFGYDFAHAGDEDNPTSEDMEAVMRLTEEWEKELMDFFMEGNAPRGAE